MIRRMQLADLQQILEIEKECFKVPWPKIAFLNILTREDNYSIVYELETIIGYGISLILSDSIYIANLAVKDKFRRQGIGSMLLSNMLRYGYKIGRKKAKLEVRISNTPAISLYEKLGFRRAGVIKCYYPDGEDALIMKRNSLI
ncbi:MAG TPA: ribosomal-protein-alanine N-acetyltransferase [bacterium (Candidatus Stahlbacteria)]|nr:ribosomal-protein-alanine N-acetyltransferase [Candidatus Stahlbacteria bacterium]